MNKEIENLIPMYKLKELAELEWKSPITIKRSWKYIKIKYEDWHTRGQYKYWTTKKPYWVRYIKFEDVRNILEWKVDFIYLKK